MRILIFGAGSFIGTNLTLEYYRNNKRENHLILFDKSERYFENIKNFKPENVSYVVGDFTNTDFDELVSNIDVVYHLMSTTIPATSNEHIFEDFNNNVLVSIKLFDACVRKNVKKIVFISSGGTVYGKENISPLNESMETNPVSAYGVQKVTIEKLLILYNYLFGIDYRVIRLSNPYGPFQRIDGGQGVITTFMYRAMRKLPIYVYGDGNIVRDYIYIDDAVSAIIKIVDGDGIDLNGVEHKIYNVGSGKGTSINQIVTIIKNEINYDLDVIYQDKRKCDVPVNYLDTSLYESIYGRLEKISLLEGVKLLKNYLTNTYFAEENNERDKS